MSYSYLKSVFPKFEYTTDFENTKFNTIGDDKLNSFTQSLIASDLQGMTKSSAVPYGITDTSAAPYGITDTSAAPYGITDSSAAPYNNNYTIHKDLAPNYNYNSIAPSTPPHIIETFQDNVSPSAINNNMPCNLYMKHIMECNKCRNMIVKQWNLDNDRIRNEEIMEIITYIIFGIVLLLLFETIKNR